MIRCSKNFRLGLGTVFVQIFNFKKGRITSIVDPDQHWLAWIRISIGQSISPDPDPAFTVMRIRILTFNGMLIRIPDPTSSFLCGSGSCFHSDADPDPAFPLDADPASQNEADPCGSWSASMDFGNADPDPGAPGNWPKFTNKQTQFPPFKKDFEPPKVVCFLTYYLHEDLSLDLGSGMETSGSRISILDPQHWQKKPYGTRCRTSIWPKFTNKPDFHLSKRILNLRRYVFDLLPTWSITCP